MSELIKIKGKDLFTRQHKCPDDLMDEIIVMDRDYKQKIVASDGYHTFEELYNHRITLFIALCKLYDVEEITRKNVWRSKVNGDGSVWEGWFILGINRDKGKQITYHLPLDRWEETDFAETLEQAPEFDGHTSDDVIERLKNL